MENHFRQVGPMIPCVTGIDLINAVRQRTADAAAEEQQSLRELVVEATPISPTFPNSPVPGLSSLRS